jgi:hypothetical protein
MKTLFLISILSIGCSLEFNANSAVPRYISDVDCETIGDHNKDLYFQRVDELCPENVRYIIKTIVDTQTDNWADTCPQTLVITTQYDFDCYRKTKTFSNLYECSMTSEWGQKQISMAHDFDQQLVTRRGCKNP